MDFGEPISGFGSGKGDAMMYGDTSLMTLALGPFRYLRRVCEELLLSGNSCVVNAR